MSKSGFHIATHQKSQCVGTQQSVPRLASLGKTFGKNLLTVHFLWFDGLKCAFKLCAPACGVFRKSFSSKPWVALAKLARSGQAKQVQGRGQPDSLVAMVGLQGQFLAFFDSFSQQLHPVEIMMREHDLHSRGATESHFCCRPDLTAAAFHVHSSKVWHSTTTQQNKHHLLS